MSDDIREKFTRTTCACERCKNCCKTQPGPLAPGDMERIAEFRGEDLETAKRNFVASPGLVLIDRITGRLDRIGTITPKSRKGRCVFLDDQDRCTIHPVAPFGCAYFDMHMDDATADRRGLAVAREQARPDYQELRNTLQLSEKYLKQLRERQ